MAEIVLVRGTPERQQSRHPRNWPSPSRERDFVRYLSRRRRGDGRRSRRHQQARGTGWITIARRWDLPRGLRGAADSSVILVDCDCPLASSEHCCMGARSVRPGERSGGYECAVSVRPPPEPARSRRTKWKTMREVSPGSADLPGTVILDE